MPDTTLHDLTTTLERVALATLRPHPRNDGVHPPEELDHLKQSLTEHGVYRNVVIANDGTILAGHGVVQAAQELGMTHIAAQRMPYGPEDAQALKLVVGDNHIARLRTQDDVLLAELLADIAAEGPGALLGTGFDADAMERLLETTRNGTPHAENQDDSDDFSGDGTLLQLLDVTLDDPRHSVTDGAVFQVMGRHVLICAEVITGWAQWKEYLVGPDWLCCPYPGPFVVLSEKATTHHLLLIQPVPYLCGHILDRVADIYGEDAIVPLPGGPHAL